MTTIKLPVQREWSVYEDCESLYVEIDLEQLREFIEQVLVEREQSK
jgi:hypothetical protein